MLHIHNGDSSGDIAKRSQLPGAHFVFREALIEGPTPAGRTGDEWRAIRARHLSDVYDIELKQCERELQQQENKLATFADHDEVVLWFEHDLFCQTILLYLLDWFSRQELRGTLLSLVCIDSFPGVTGFRGLGELSSEQLASLFPDRRELQSSDLELGRAAWQAYCSPDPGAIEELLKGDTSALPFLAAALRAHLKRFPSFRDGLGAIENSCLELIIGGASDFSTLFSRFGDVLPVYGLGDDQLWLNLRRMSAVREPMLKIAGLDGDAATSALNAETLRNARFEITESGKSVLRGETDFVSLNGIDHWLGGVHLEGATTPFRWDDSSERIVSR